MGGRGREKRAGSGWGERCSFARRKEFWRKPAFIRSGLKGMRNPGRNFRRKIICCTMEKSKLPTSVRSVP